MTHVAQCALEYWRSHGKRNRARLLELVAFFAKSNGELDRLSEHELSAVAFVRSWEKEGREW